MGGLGPIFRIFLHFFAFVSHFWRILNYHRIFYRFFSNFDRFGRDLEALGASWVVLGSPFFTLVFGVVVKSALGGTSAGLWLDFQGFGEDFGRVWGGFWWVLEGFLGGVGMLLLAIACFCLLAAARCCLLLLSWSFSSKSVLAFVCCLLGHAFVSWSLSSK